MKIVWLSFARRRRDWTWMVPVGNRVGRIVVLGIVHKTLTRVSLESCVTAGNIGLLPLQEVDHVAWPHRCWTLSHSVALREERRSCVGTLPNRSTGPEFTIQPHLFRTILLERMWLPLQLTEACYEGCHAQVDEHGRHRACSAPLRQSAWLFTFSVTQERRCGQTCSSGT